MKNSFIFFLMAFILFSCENESLQAPEQRTLDETLKNSSLLEKEKSDYDKFMRKFAKTLAKSLENKELRREIKNEALLQIDGDYDIIVKNFKYKKIKTNDGVNDVKGILAEQMDRNAKRQKIEEIDAFNEKYKRLQISVPVNCESWQVETYVPYVAFMPYDYDETWEQVEAYDSKGNIIKLNNRQAPEYPVVVIGMNERSDENGDILDGVLSLKKASVGDDDPVVEPCYELDQPHSLIAESLDNSIRITWSQLIPPNRQCLTGYKIYRMAEDESTFQQIATVGSRYAMIYYDSDFESSDGNKSFSYRVKAYGDGGESYPSEIVSALAPNPPNEVVSFDVSNFAYRTAFLNWDNDISEYHTETRLYRSDVSSNPNFVLRQSFTDNTSDLFETNLTPGSRYLHKIVHVNDIAESNGKYDIVQVPYRDISQNSPVYIKQILITDEVKSVESWLAGHPEFYITVTSFDKSTGTPYTVQEQLNFEFSSWSHTSQIFYGRKILDWRPDNWMDMLSFTVIEYDRPSNELKLTASVGYNTKDEDKKGFHASAGADLEITFSNSGERCGNSYLNYYDEAEKWIEFPGEGLIKILVSETDN